MTKYVRFEVKFLIDSDDEAAIVNNPEGIFITIRGKHQEEMTPENCA